MLVDFHDLDDPLISDNLNRYLPDVCVWLLIVRLIVDCAIIAQDLDRVFASQYVQSGTFGAEAQGIENSVKGVGWVSLMRQCYAIEV